MRGMLRRSVLGTGALVLWLSLGCAPSEYVWEEGGAPTEAVQSALREACAQDAAGVSCGLQKVTRRLMANGVVAYEFHLKVGPGEHDTIAIHRLVRERKSGVAANTRRAVFLVHGAAWGFSAPFAGGAAGGDAPSGSSLAGYLAAQDFDVWGIDHRWVLVPEQTPDLNFMKDWTLASELGDLRLGLGFARAIRTTTGQGAQKLALMGWSNGALQAYVYAGAESQRPPGQRHVDALVPIDDTVKYPPGADAYRQVSCASHDRNAEALAQGIFGFDNGPQKAIGLVAIEQPEAPSAAFPGFTNLEAVWFLAGATYLAGEAYSPAYHLLAATWGPEGKPIGLAYAETESFLRLTQQVAAYQSLPALVDADALRCGEVDSPHDDHFADVRLPVLYVGGAGGAGELGFHTTTLLGSTDVTQLLVRLQPEGQELTDYGHGDLLLAGDAETRAWQSMRDWLLSH